MIREAERAGDRRRGRIVRIAVQIVGLALLAAAVAVVASRRDELAAAWETAKGAPAWQVPAMLALPLVNWLITSLIFWVLMRPHGRVGLWEMGALIGSAWLLNMLPFKPGFVGRVAYHKAMSGISVRTTLLVTLVALLSGSVGIVIAVLAQIGLDSGLRDAVPTGRLLPVLLGVVLVAGLTGAAIAVYRGWGELARHGGPLAAAILLRVLDTHVWATRYALAFGMIGHGQPYGVCVVIAGLSQIAGQVPVAVGLREWAVGVSATVLRGTPFRSLGAGAAIPGLTADLLCRVAEVVCAVPVGLISSAWIYRRVGRERRGHAAGSSRGSGNSHPASGV